MLVAFGDRNGGVSDPPFDTLNVSRSVGDAGQAATNRKRVAASLGFDVGSLAFVKQVHGADVLEAPPGCSGVQGEGDGLVAPCSRCRRAESSRPTAFPCCSRADRGSPRCTRDGADLVAGVLQRGVEAVGPVTAAWIGPSIHACCYEVGDDVTGAFERAGLPVSGPRRVDPSDARAFALERAGVANIARSGRVHVAATPNYFSYRRDGDTGRQGNFIALLESAT